MKKTLRLSESDLHRVIAESVKAMLHEGDERFLPSLQKTYETLYREYEKWQYATYKAQGMDEAIDAILDAAHAVKDIIDRLSPSEFDSELDDPTQV